MKANLLTFVRGLKNGTPPRFQSYLKSLTLLLVMMMSVNVWGAEKTIKFTPDATTTGSSATSYGTVNCTISEIGWTFNQYNPSSRQVKTNQSSAGNEFNFKNTSALPGKIKSVVITFQALSVSDASKLCFIGGSSAISSLSGGSAGTWNSTAKTLTWEPASTTNYTYFAFYQNGKAASGTNNLAEKDAIVITYEAAATEKYTVTLKDDNTELKEASAGAGVELPTRDDCGDYIFQGWSETNCDIETEDEPTLVTINDGKYYPSKNITLYPIYKKTVTETGSATSYKITYKKGTNDSGTTKAAIDNGSDYASLSTNSYAYQRTNGMHLSSGSNAGNATLTLTAAGKVNASSIVTNALAKSEKSFTIMVTYTDATTKSETFTPGTTTKDNELELDDTKTISTIYYSASSGSGAGIASTTVNYTPSVTTITYYSAPKCSSATLTGITVSGTPAEFWKGDAFNHNGITVTANYDDATSENVTTKAEFSTPDMTTAGEKTITVTYKDKTDTYKINVQTIANTAETAYTTAKAIEIIDAGKDLATQVYVKGTVSKVNGYYSNKYITYFLDEDAFEIYNGLGKEGAAFSSQDDIQVEDEVVVYGQLTKHSSVYEFAQGNQLVSLTRPKKLTSITVSGTPDYFDTQSSFNHNGMTVTAHYNTGASDDADVTASAVFTAPDMTTQGEKTVNVSYTENEIKKETSYKIQVAQYCANVVTITKGDEENGTFSLSQTGNICADGGLTISVTNIVPAEHYHFKEITTTNGTVNDKTVTGITDDAIITVVFEEDTKYELKWMVSGEQMGETQSLYEGDDVTAPTGTVEVPEACANEGKVFVGWTADTDVDPETAPTFFAPHKMGTEPETYYAVFATEGGTPITWTKMAASEISESGTYALIESSGKAFNGTISSGHGQSTATAFAFNNNVATSAPEGTLELELTAYGDEEDGYVFDIYNSTKGYLYAKKASSGNLAWSTKALGDDDFWTYYSDEEETNFEFWHNVDNDAYYASLRYSSSTFRTYVSNSTTGTIVAFAKKNGGVVYSDYVTSCVIPTATITAAVEAGQEAIGSVAIYNDVPEAVTNPYTFNKGEDFMLEATVSDDAYRFKEWTMSEGSDITLDDATDANPALVAGAVDVTFTAHFELIPTEPRTVKFNAGELGTYDGGDITEEEAEGGITLPAATPNDKYYAFVGWSTSSTAENADAGAAGENFKPTEDNQTLYAVYAQLYKVILKYTDEVKWQTTAGGAIELPSRDCKNETYKGHFAGWSETEFATETTNPATAPTIIPVGEYTPTEDVVLYPVFSVSAEGTQWKKMTTAALSESGIYAMIGNDNKAYNGSISSGHGQSTETSFAFDANGIATTAPEGTCELTFTALGDGHFTIYQQGKGYLYGKAASSGNLAWHETESYYWMWYSNGSQWEYKNNNTYVYLRYNNSNFRTYGNSTGTLIELAKKESVAETKYWSTPANDVTNPELDTPAGDYLSPLTVKITDASYDDDLMYYYTVDGTTPAADAELNPTGTSTMYDPEIGIVLQPANTYNLQVIGYDEDGYTSQIASATYVLYPVFNSISAMYTGAVVDKPVGLALTNAYVHAVNTIGVNSQIFVQQGDLGVVLSTTSVPDGVAAGKQISGTAIGTYEIKNDRPQISKFAFQSTFMVEDGSRPEPTTITETTADLVSTHLLRLVKLEGVYAQSDANNIIVVNSNAEGTGTSMNVYDFFNKVSTIPASDVKCNVIGLFNERKDGSDPIVYSIMPVLDTDFDVVEKQNATLPTVNPLGSTVETEPTKVASGETVTITPAAGFTTSYKINDAAEWTPITTQKVQPTITEENTKIEVKATRPYYNDASATYYYEIDPGLTKYHITLPSVQTYYKISSGVTDQKAGETVTLTISNITEHWNITAVTVEKADDATTTVEVANPETNIYTFVMPAYAVNVKVSYKSDPTYNIDYLKGLSSGVIGDDITESKQYAGVELALKECTWKAAGYTFKNWYAYYLDDESQEVAITITDNKIIVPAHNVKIKAMWDEAAWHKDGTWELVTKTSELGVGDYVIFTDTQEPGDDVTRYAGTSTIKGEGKNLQVTSNISISGNKLTRTNNDATMIFQIETGNETNTYAFYADGIGYLNANGTSTNNYMITTESKASTNASWTIESIAATNGEAVVKAKSENRNQMQVNVSNRIFAAYNSKQGGLAIYKFYPKSWTVTFDDNVEDEEIAVPEMQRADPTTNKVTISTDVPVRTGYDFSIWNSAKGGTGELTANPGDEITLTANKTLYAQWNIKQYNVAVAEVENVTIQAKPHSEDAIAEGANTNVNFKKSVVLSYTDLDDAYVFKSWKVTKADDETTVVPISVGSSTTFEVPAYAVTVSAIIESKATTQLTVTYHANGGVNKTPEGPEEVSEQVNWNTTIKFAEHPCPFEKNLCTFAGWNTKADGTGTTYKTQVTVKTDIDLYAMWEASAVEYVIDDNVEAKVKVKEGVAPASSTATFETTYTGTFGQLTKTNSGTLTLTGYAGKVITGVKMQMKSNANSGAGTIVIKVGDKEICSTSYAESFGSHSNSYSVAELANFNAAIIGETENITIVVSCTDNSLYINGYTIEYTDPEIIRNELTAEQYTTFCWPKTIPANAYTGATFWNIEDKTTMADGRLSSITIVQHEGDLEAGVPYIMYNTATEFKCYQTGEAVDAPAAEGNNGLVGVFETTMFDTEIRPVTDDADAAARGIYIISDGTLYLCGNNCGVYANRAYIKNSLIETVPGPVSAPRRTIGKPSGTPTTLNGLFSNQSIKAQKALIDGHIYIIRDNKMYNVQGQFVK